MKKPFYDIIPNEKRSIRNIPITKKTEATQIIHNARHSTDGIRTHKKHKIITEDEPEIVDEDLENPIPTKKNDDDESFEDWRSSKKDSFWRAWVAIGTLLVMSVIIFSVFFSSAVVTINPIKHDFVLKETSIPLDSIKHEEISTDLEESEEVEANGTVKIDRKATGKIILYNAFNSSTQKLVEGTRLETPNGLIYKLKSTVTVPAQKTVSGKKVPGSIDAEVEASQTGDTYNQGFKDFNVVAYKGSDRYSAIYGRSKTALVNGFSGTIPNILAKDTSAATEKIKDKIAKSADDYFTKEAKSKGETFVYIPSTKQITFSDAKQEVSKNGKTATIKITGKVTTVLFDSPALFEQIIKKQTNDSTSASSTPLKTETEGSPAEIFYTGDSSKLVVSLGDANNILVSGTTTISSAIDSIKVSRAVSGLDKEQAIGAIKRLVELETIEIDIRPWWNKKLPSSDRIKINTEE